MIVKVAARELLPGMYVADLNLAPQEFPQVYPREGLLKSMAEVDALVRQGYREAFVDDNRSTVPVHVKNLWDDLQQDDATFHPEVRRTPPASSHRGHTAHSLPDSSAVQASLEQAITTYSASIETVENMFSALRKEKELPVEALHHMADTVVDNILADNLALVTLAKLQAHDDYTFSHCTNVSVMATLFGRHLHMSEEVLRLLALGGLLHDIGKAMIPLNLLNTARRLTDKEFALMKTHALAGYEAIKDATGLPLPVKLAVLEHHERVDGSGYPYGRKGKEISIIGRMMAVVDVYDALTSKRVYKPALLPYTAVSFLFSQRDRSFDPALIDRFIQCVGVYPVGSVVQLTNGAMGVVFLANPDKPLLPVVALVTDSQNVKCPLTMADLAAEPTLRIQNCLDPMQAGINCAALLKACALAAR